MEIVSGPWRGTGDGGQLGNLLRLPGRSVEARPRRADCGSVPWELDDGAGQQMTLTDYGSERQRGVLSVSEELFRYEMFGGVQQAEGQYIDAQLPMDYEEGVSLLPLTPPRKRVTFAENTVFSEPAPPSPATPGEGKRCDAAVPPGSPLKVAHFLNFEEGEGGARKAPASPEPRAAAAAPRPRAAPGPSKKKSKAPRAPTKAARFNEGAGGARKEPPAIAPRPFAGPSPAKSQSKGKECKAPRAPLPEATFPGLRPRAPVKCEEDDHDDDDEEEQESWNWKCRADARRKEYPNKELFRRCLDKAAEQGLIQYGAELKELTSIQGRMVKVLPGQLTHFMKLICEDFWRNDTTLDAKEVQKRTAHVMRQMELTDEPPRSMFGTKDLVLCAFKNALINSGLTYSDYEYLPKGFKKGKSYVRTGSDYRAYWKSDSWRICDPKKARAASAARDITAKRKRAPPGDDDPSYAAPKGKKSKRNPPDYSDGDPTYVAHGKRKRIEAPCPDGPPPAPQGGELGQGAYLTRAARSLLALSAAHA